MGGDNSTQCWVCIEGWAVVILATKFSMCGTTVESSGHNKQQAQT
jgi:hypothetical protein